MNSILKHLFSGNFSFERLISSPRLRITGIATFKKGPDNQILYHEEGQYRLEGTQQTCYQNQIFVVEDSSLTVYGHDNSVLHVFKLDQLQTVPLVLNHTHHCKEDLYSLTWSIHSTDSFAMAYIVKGPSKDYRIHTDFTRICL